MTKEKQLLSTFELVARFVELALGQDEAELDGNISRYNKLFREMTDVRSQLKQQPGDKRTTLLDLYNHPNLQVRLMAAKSTLAVAPNVARRQLESIANSKQYPQAGDAGMCLDALDRGIFKPS